MGVCIHRLGRWTLCHSFLGSPQDHPACLAELVVRSRVGLRLLWLCDAARGEPLRSDSCALIQFRRQTNFSESYASSSAAPGEELQCGFVHLVSWSSVEAKHGRIFLEDADGKLKWTVPSVQMFKIQCFQGRTVLLPDAGVEPVT